MSIADRIYARDDIENALPEELTKLSMKISRVYNPLTNADLPFVSACLKLQLDGMLAIMSDDKAAMDCYDSVLCLCRVASVAIPKNIKGVQDDGI